LSGDGCEPTCELAPLGGSTPPQARLLFGTGSGGSGGGSAQSVYNGWESDGFEATAATAAYPVPQACVHETAPGQPIDAKLTSTVFDVSGFDTTATISFTAAVTPSTAKGLNPAVSDGTGGVGSGGAGGGFGGASGTGGAWYGGNGGGGGGYGSGSGSGTGGGYGGYYAGGSSSSGTLAGYTSGNAGVGGGGGAFTGTGYPGSQVTTYVECTYDGGATWHIVEAVPGYWQGSQSFRIPLYDPTVPGAVPGPGFQVRLRCEGTSGDQGFYLGVSDFQLVKGDANVGPSLSPRPSELVLQRGETRVVDFQLSDPDGAPGPLGFLFQGPDFATFQDLGGGLGRLTLAPRADQPYGWYSARLQYSDGAIVGSQWVNLVVPAPPPPPTKCVKIRSAPDGGGVEVGALTLTKGASTTLYAAAYSDAACTAYIGETNVYWRHDGTLPETTVGPFAVYYYTARVAGVAGTITTEHPDPSVVNDVTGTLTLTKAPPGPLDPTRALVAASPAAIPADGATVTTLTVTLTDDRGQTITDAGHTVVFAAPTSGTLLGAVSQNADGTWSQALRAPATVGSATLTATADGQALTASATVLFTENRDTAVLAETTDGKITCADVAGLAGRDLIVSTPITVDIDPAVAGCEAQLLYLQNLTVKPTGSLTHTATATTAGTPERVLNLSVANLTIESASASVYGKIDVTGRGYGVNRTFDNSGTGATTTTYQAGSHGGLGGKAPATAFVYDDFRDPRRPGAGSSAVAGGGVVRIAVRSGGAARVDGKILADGSPGTAGGAGGTIALSTPSLTGSGSLSAQGGAATNTNGGGGGGGRIALTGMASASGAFAPEAFGDAVLACGGADTNTSLDQAGGAGSVWFQTTSGSAQGGILVYDACGRIGADRSTPMNVLPQGTYSALTATQVSTTSVPTSAPSRFVGSTVALTPLSTFDGLFDEPAATVTGFGSILLDRDLTARAAASGTYRALTTVGVLQVKNGARVDAVGDLYVLAGSLADPATFTLDGTLEAKRLDLGNANAITVRGKGDLRVTEQIISRNQANFRFPYTIDGGKVTVSVAGMPLGSVTVYNGGSLAGSGGVVHGDAVFDAPNFTANPISGFSFLADLLIKGGSFSADDVSVGGDLSVFGGGFVARYARVGGDVLFDAGATLTLKGTTNGEGLRGLVADGDIVAQGQSAGGVATKLSHQRPNNDSGNVSGSPSALYLAADNVRVVAPAIIDVSGKGWNGPYGPINNTAYIAQSDEGGSHGGRGAATVAANRPLAYDSATAPTLPGAGGYTSGHYGGGAAIVVATTSIALSSVDANASLTGGGAGGTISLRAGESIRVDGTLTARGGNGNGQNRAGGGGRIAVVAGGSLLGALATDPRAATDASGGVYGATTVTSGGAGTIWLDDGFSLPTLMVDNRPDGGGNPRSGSQATIADGTPYPFQGVGAMSALGAGVSPSVPAEFTATPSFETAPLALGQSFLVLPDNVVRRVVGVESGTGAWLLDAPATGLTGAGHTWCALLDLAHLDVLGNAQLQHNGCVRVAGSNVGDGTPTSWDLDGGVNVARLDLGPVTSVALTGPVARFDAGAQLGAGGVLGYPFTATLSGRLSAASLLLGALTATTSETTRPTIDVAGAASLASFTVTGSPQPVELKAGSVTVGDALDQTGGYITAGDVLVKGRTALSGVAVDLTGAWTVTAEASGATGAFSQAGGSFAADALSAAGPVSFTGTPVTLIGHGEGVVSLASITLSGAATVVSHVLHDASLTDRRALRLTAPVVEFLAGASIDVAGRGFRGATNNGYAPLAALRATSSGGSHGGMGASTSLASRAKTYDDLYAPTLAGGGGSYANAHGGGAVIIAATTRATLGAIDASGISGASNYGGGAGGAINVSAPEIVVNGLLSVRGGNSLNTSYLGGGGGMIALLAGSTLTNNVGAGPWDMVVLRGGSY
ncbi:MAG: hypothetical protein KC635_03315, partial [Myxococcales bacterium]|nr:hypothetical protein [Myxococcales bacterium]